MVPAGTHISSLATLSVAGISVAAVGIGLVGVGPVGVGPVLGTPAVSMSGRPDAKVSGCQGAGALVIK